MRWNHSSHSTATTESEVCSLAVECVQFETAVGTCTHIFYGVPRASMEMNLALIDRICSPLPAEQRAAHEDA